MCYSLLGSASYQERWGCEMKTNIFIACLGILLAVVALSVYAESAQSRVLTQDEMRQTLGKIGDGCPCNTTNNDDSCNQPDECEKCGEKQGSWPDPTPCPADNRGRIFRHKDFVRCYGAGPYTCHDGTEDWCTATYWCNKWYVENKKCDGNGECTASGTGWYCIYCHTDRDHPVEDTTTHMRAQTCTQP